MQRLLRSETLTYLVPLAVPVFSTPAQEISKGNNLEISEATITIKDEGNVCVWVDDELKGYIHGRGQLLLKGQPRIKEFVME